MVSVVEGLFCRSLLPYYYCYYYYYAYFLSKVYYYCYYYCYAEQRHARRSTQSQIRSASVEDAATITDSRSDTVLSFKCPVWRDQSCRDSGSTNQERTVNGFCSWKVYGFCPWMLLFMVSANDVLWLLSLDVVVYGFRRRRRLGCTVSFHNFKSQKFKLSVSNPKSKYVAYLSVLSQNSNCQGLGRKNKFEN